MNQQHVEHFHQRHKELAAFHKDNGRWPSVSSADPLERSLAEWCHKTKLAHSRGKLENYRLDALRAIGYPMRKNEVSWNDSFEKLKLYLDAHGKMPPIKDKIYSFAYRQYNRWTKLSGEERAKLDSIGLRNFFPARNSEELWRKKFESLKQFYREYGKLPSRKTNMPLEFWVNTQRQRLKKGVLEDAKVKLFEDAGIDLLKRSFEKESDGWEQAFAQLQSFVRTKGRLPCLKLAKESSLFKWLLQQTSLAQSKELEPRRLNMLTSIFSKDIGSVFRELQTEKFETAFKELKEFYEDHQRWPQVKMAETTEERRLIKWCIEKRNEYRDNKLSAFEQGALKSIGFLLNPDAERRAAGFKELEAYLESSGGTLQRFHPLYRFYCRQKKIYETLGPGHKACLDRVVIEKISSSARYIFNWEERFEQVLHFIDENKRTPSPGDDEQIRRWWIALKTKIKQGKLSTEKMELLVKTGVLLFRDLDTWEEKFEQVKSYVQKFHRWPGSLDPREKEMRSWIYRQRIKFKNGKLSEAEIGKLKGINVPLMKKERSKKLL